MTIATSQRDATDYEKTALHAVRTQLLENSLEVGSFVIGAKNELAEKGGLLLLQLAENLGYDFDVRPSIIKVYADLAGYEDVHASQATQLRGRAEVMIFRNALEIRDMLHKGLL